MPVFFNRFCQGMHILGPAPVRNAVGITDDVTVSGTQKLNYPAQLAWIFIHPHTPVCIHFYGFDKLFFNIF
jgi:hypothetical protein